MWSKRLVIGFSLIFIFTGFGFIWFGTRTVDLPVANNPPQISETPKIATESSSLGIQGEKALVSKVVDGDTINLSDGRTVRFVGIDTPETVDPRRPVGCFGKEASNEVKNLLSEKTVILQKDITDKDKYERILRYIYLPLETGEILFVQDYLVREGFAKVYTYPPDVRFDSQFREAENAAKLGKKGLWGKC